MGPYAESAVQRAVIFREEDGLSVALFDVRVRAANYKVISWRAEVRLNRQLSKFNRPIRQAG